MKTELPGEDAFSCPEIDPGPQPSPEEQAQARVLGSNAGQADLLGDVTRVRDLLARAVELDPHSAELAYRYGRSLDELGEAQPAIDQFCRALSLGSEELGIEDARPRMEALVRSQQPQIPADAVTEFRNGLTQAGLGNVTEAIQAFSATFLMAPDWADAVYNRGVLRDRQGDVDGAVSDFQLYLSLDPEGEDGIAVSQRIGQLQSSTPLPSPGTTLTLGAFFPGMGQFYSGRALGGFTVLALAGGIAAAGFLIEEVQTKCVGTVPQGGECPPDRIIGVETTNPYKTQSLMAAGAVTLIGAIEAFIKVRRGDSGPDEDLIALNVGKTHIVGPSVSSAGPRLNLSFFRVMF